jgi:hypothetical protein
MASGQTFTNWAGDTSYLASVVSATNTGIMPANAVTVTASYVTVTNSSPQTYSLTVNGGTGSGNYAAGTTVAIAAAAVSGQAFTNWTGDTSYLASVVSATTTVTMPSNGVTVTANYVANSLSQTTPSAVTNGLVAQWTLAGDITDHVGANNAVAFGSPGYVAGPTGAANLALSLDGSSQYLLSTALGDFGAGCASGFTLTAWVQSSYTSGCEAIFGSQSQSGMAISLYLNYGCGVGAGRIEGFVRDGANSIHACDVASDTGVVDGNWHFIVWVDNPAANSGTIYIDGVALNTSAPFSAAPATADLPNPMGLGCRSGINDGFFNGALADCRIYNRTLSATEVGTLFANGAAGAAGADSSVPAPPSNLEAGPPRTN